MEFNSFQDLNEIFLSLLFLLIKNLMKIVVIVLLAN